MARCRLGDGGDYARQAKQRSNLEIETQSINLNTQSLSPVNHVQDESYMHLLYTFDWGLKQISTQAEIFPNFHLCFKLQLSTVDFVHPRSTYLSTQ